MTTVMITGVRGKTGVPLAELLAARPEVEVRGGSSNPSSVTIDGVIPTAFSWDDPAGWHAAVAGIDAVYLVRPDRADAPELIADFLTVVPGSARIVLLSERDVDSFAPGSWARRIEQLVRDSGRVQTALRPSWFMQVFDDDRFYAGALAEGILPFASGGAALAWIDARDIAAVAECALLQDGHDGEVYELSGAEALTLPQTADVLASALGRPVAHREVSIADAVADLPDGFERDEFVWTLERVRDGVFAGVVDTVERVTGRPPRPLADLFRT